MPILRHAGKAPHRRRPFNSALGGERYMPWLAHSAGAVFHMASAASRGQHLQVPSFATIRVQFRPQQVRQEQAALQTALGCRRLRGPLRLLAQAHGRRHRGRRSSRQRSQSASSPQCTVQAWLGQSAQRHAHWQRGSLHSGSCRIGVASAPLTPQLWPPSSHTSPPNPSLHRSANGMAPCPRGAPCLSCASRARRHAAVAR